MIIVIGLVTGVAYFGFNRALESYIDLNTNINFWHIIAPAIASVFCFLKAEPKVTANSYVKPDKKLLVKAMGANLALYIILVTVSIPTSLRTWVYVFFHLIPMFVISSILFQRLSLRVAADFKASDYNAKSIINLDLHNIKKFNDENIARFLSAVNPGIQYYFLSTDGHIGVGGSPFSSLKSREYLIAFDDQSVYFFDVSTMGNKIVGYSVANREHVEILNTKSRIRKWINIELRFRGELREISALSDDKMISKQKVSLEEFIDNFKI